MKIKSYRDMTLALHELERQVSLILDKKIQKEYTADNGRICLANYFHIKSAPKGMMKLVKFSFLLYSEDGTTHFPNTKEDMEKVLINLDFLLNQVQKDTNNKNDFGKIKKLASQIKNKESLVA